MLELSLGCYGGDKNTNGGPDQRGRIPDVLQTFALDELGHVGREVMEVCLDIVLENQAAEGPGRLICRNQNRINTALVRPWHFKWYFNFNSHEYLFFQHTVQRWVVCARSSLYYVSDSVTEIWLEENMNVLQDAQCRDSLDVFLQTFVGTFLRWQCDILIWLMPGSQCKANFDITWVLSQRMFWQELNTVQLFQTIWCKFVTSKFEFAFAFTGSTNWALKIAWLFRQMLTTEFSYQWMFFNKHDWY